MATSIGTLTGFDLSAKPHGASDYKRNITASGGTVVLESGAHVDYGVASIPVDIRYYAGDVLRVFAIDAMLANPNGIRGKNVARRGSARVHRLECDTATEPGRGVYAGGLIVLGTIEIDHANRTTSQKYSDSAKSKGKQWRDEAIRRYSVFKNKPSFAECGRKWGYTTFEDEAGQTVVFPSADRIARVLSEAVNEGII